MRSKQLVGDIERELISAAELWWACLRGRDGIRCVSYEIWCELIMRCAATCFGINVMVWWLGAWMGYADIIPLQVRQGDEVWC